MKKCSKCNLYKSLKYYYKNQNTKDGYHNQCKDCRKIANKNYREKYHFKMIIYDIKRRCENKKRKDYKYYGGRGIQCLITEDEIKELWFRDEAWLLKQPTIDRKNVNGNYTFDNCEFIEKGLNSSKDKIKPILQFDLDGKFIKEWESIINIERSLKFNNSHITKNCKYKSYSAYGFKWRYKKERNF